MTAQQPDLQQLLGDRAYDAVKKHVQRTLKYESDVLKDRDPEALHQMRVGMRRLRSDVTGFEAAIELPKAAQNKPIGKISRTLGKLRDIDVMQEALVERYQPNLPKKERSKIEPAIATLTEQRKAALAEVRELLKGKKYQKFKKAVTKWLDRPQYRVYSQMAVGDVLPDILLPSISRVLLDPGWWVGFSKTPDNGRRPTLSSAEVEAIIANEGYILHELRKQAKRVRYLMNSFADLYGPTYQTYLEDMRELQEVLGNIQDSCVMGEFLSKVFHCDLKRETPKFAELLEQTRFESWQRWQVLQGRYLNPQIRQNFHREILRGIERIAIASTEVEPNEKNPVSAQSLG
ncbi:CHAD domain-containing protein [Baaleninema simplex]|uniref:CHAD domain-containing protein n=1 Tax=Baaleninema simplex TaxID=2862350 RepID=UPI00034C12E7|nr:CHAD domain-containing protein [Baaleninema simplex]